MVGNSLMIHHLRMYLSSFGEETSTGGKTLKSGPDDHVFIVYSDHGGPGPHAPAGRHRTAEAPHRHLARLQPAAREHRVVAVSGRQS